MRFPYLQTFASLCILIGASFPARAADDYYAPLADVKGAISDHAAEILANATRVESFRIKRLSRQPGGKLPQTLPADHFQNYQILSRGKELDKDFSARFSKVALDGNTYQNVVSGCFSPGVAFRFWRDKESVDVLLCFHCGNISITTTTKQDGYGLTFHNERGRPKFVKLAKEAFPDDPEIQNVKE